MQKILLNLYFANTKKKAVFSYTGNSVALQKGWLIPIGDSLKATIETIEVRFPKPTNTPRLNEVDMPYISVFCKLDTSPEPKDLEKILRADGWEISLLSSH